MPSYKGRKVNWLAAEAATVVWLCVCVRGGGGSMCGNEEKRT